MERAGEQAIDEDADGRLGLGFRGGASVLAAPVLLFVDGVYRAMQWSAVSFPDNLERHATGWFV